MARTDETFKQALVGKKIPILTLDNKWHKLFTQSEFTPELKGLEKKLNDLLKRQAKLTSETKEIKKLKKKLMDEVVLLADEMGERPTKKQDKDMEDHKRLIEECNEKMDAYEEELVELPREISQVNNQLMLITMEVCYKKLKHNTKELDEIDEWISEIRRELKKKVVRKKEKEAVINKLYAYMHDIFGAEVLELFDMQYDPEEKYRRKDTEAQEISKEKQDGQTEQNEQTGQQDKGAAPGNEDTQTPKS